MDTKPGQLSSTVTEDDDEPDIRGSGCQSVTETMLQYPEEHLSVLNDYDSNRPK